MTVGRIYFQGCCGGSVKSQLGFLSAQSSEPFWWGGGRFGRINRPVFIIFWLFLWELVLFELFFSILFSWLEKHGAFWQFGVIRNFPPQINTFFGCINFSAFVFLPSSGASGGGGYYLNLEFTFSRGVIFYIYNFGARNFLRWIPGNCSIQQLPAGLRTLGGDKTRE